MQTTNIKLYCLYTSYPQYLTLDLQFIVGQSSKQNVY